MYNEAKSKTVEIVKTLDYLERNQEGLKPVQLGDARAYTLSVGLMMIAESFGVKLRSQQLHIDALGEFEFFLAPGQTYGDGLAALLSTVHTRTGVIAIKGYVESYHTWVRINHFEAEKLIRNAAKSFEEECLTNDVVAV